jgi:hypothetical protein
VKKRKAIEKKILPGNFFLIREKDNTQNTDEKH